MSKKAGQKRTYYRVGNLLKLPSNNKLEIDKIMEEYGEYLEGICAKAREDAEKEITVSKEIKEPESKEEEDNSDNEIINLIKQRKSYIKRAVLNILCLLYFSLMDKNLFIYEFISLIVKSMLIGYCSALAVEKVFKIYKCTTEIHNMIKNNSEVKVITKDLDQSNEPIQLYETELALENYKGAQTYNSMEINEDRGPRLVLRVKNPYNKHN